MSSIHKILRSLADPGRLRTLAVIVDSGELCVCEVEKLLGMTVSTASRNLRELETTGWLTSRREGRWMYYSLREMDVTSTTLLRAVLDAYRQAPGVREDLERLKALLAVGRGSLCVTETRAVADKDYAQE